MSIVPVQVADELGGGHITLKSDFNATAGDVKKLVLEKIAQKRRVAGISAGPALDEKMYRLGKLPLGSTTWDESDPAWPQPFFEDVNMLSQCSLPQEGKPPKICFAVALLKGTPAMSDTHQSLAWQDDPLYDLPEGRQRDTAAWRAVPKSELPLPGGLQRGSEMPHDLFLDDFEAKKGIDKVQQLEAKASQAFQTVLSNASFAIAPFARIRGSSDGEAKTDDLCSPPPTQRKLLRVRGSKDVTMHHGTLEFRRDNPNGVAWVDNEDRTNCVCCGQKFTFKKRRHHCRACGEVVCAECLTLSPVTGYERPQLVCATCREKNATAALMGIEQSEDASFQFPTLESGDLEVHAASCMGYLCRLQSSLLLGDQFVRRFHCIKIVAGKPYLWAYDSQEATEPIEQQPIIGTQIFAYSRNCFPRVKNSYCFGMRVRGNSEEIVWEAPTDVERAVWLGTLTVMGAEQLVPQPTPKRSVTSMKEGYLDKMGKVEKVSGWGVRYCVLQFNPHRLEYYQHHKDVGKKAPKGVIRLYQEVVISAMPVGYLGSGYSSFSIQPEGGRRFLFSGADEADTAEWLTVLEEVCESEKFARGDEGDLIAVMDLSEVELTGIEVEELEQMESEHRAEALDREAEIQSVQEELRMLEAELEEDNEIVRKDHERLAVMLRILEKDEGYCIGQELALSELLTNLANDEENQRLVEEEIEQEVQANMVRQQEVEEMQVLLAEREKQLVLREELRNRKDALLMHYERTWA